MRRWTPTAFAPLAELLAADHRVLTTDPRGVNRSPMADPDQDSTPELRADDLSRLLTHLDAGPATVFGSSGGAVTALALAQQRPDLVDLVIAHEPPLNEMLADREQRHAATEGIIATYRSSGRVAAWRQFLADANIVMPEEAFEYAFGGELGPQEAADEDHFFLHELRPTTRWRPDLEALRNAAHPHHGGHRRGVHRRGLRPHLHRAGRRPRHPAHHVPGRPHRLRRRPRGFHTRLRGLLAGD